MGGLQTCLLFPVCLLCGWVLLAPPNGLLQGGSDTLFFFKAPNHGDSLGSAHPPEDLKSAESGSLGESGALQSSPFSSWSGLHRPMRSLSSDWTRWASPSVVNNACCIKTSAARQAATEVTQCPSPGCQLPSFAQPSQRAPLSVPIWLLQLALY